MHTHVVVFNEVNSLGEFGYSNKQIAEWSGFDPSKVSRFLGGKTNIPSSDFFELISCMPKRFQECYWETLIGSRDKNWHSLIATASIKDIQEILLALSERWSVLNSKDSVATERVLAMQ